MNEDIIKKDFIQSWDEMEFFFERANLESIADTPIILNTLKEMRKSNYDQIFRVGQSLWSFCISRSRYWGLKENQSSISIKPGLDKYQNEGGNVIIQFWKNGSLIDEFKTSNPIKSSKFLKSLKELENEDIN